MTKAGQQANPAQGPWVWVRRNPVPHPGLSHGPLPPPQAPQPPWLFSLRSPSPPNPATSASLTEFWKNSFLLNYAKKTENFQEEHFTEAQRGKHRGRGTVSFQSADNLTTRLVEDHLVGTVDKVSVPQNSLTHQDLAGRLASSLAGMSVVPVNWDLLNDLSILHGYELRNSFL